MNKVARFGFLLLLLFFDVPVNAQPKVEVFNIEQAHLTGFLGTQNNSRINFIEDTRSIAKILGNSDSTVTAIEDLDADRYIYYGGLVFSAYEDTAVVETIDFSVNKQLKLVLGTTELSYNTTLAEFRKHFPRSYRDAQSIRNSSERVYVLLPFKGAEDMQLIFTFNKRGNLVSMTYFMGCC